MTELHINYFGITLADDRGTQTWRYRDLKWLTWRNARDTYLGCGYRTVEIRRDSRGRVCGYVMRKATQAVERWAA